MWRRYLMDRAVVQADCVTKIHLDILETDCNESHNQIDLGGSTGGALGSSKPFLESIRGTMGRQQDNIQVGR